MKKLIFLLVLIFSAYGLLFAQTIGNNAEGTLSDMPYGTMSAIRVECTQSMTATKMYVKIGVSGSGTIKCAIYSDNSGTPGTFLRGTNQLTNPGTGWKSFDLTSGQSLTSGTYYYLVLWTNSTGYEINFIWANATPWKGQTYGTWPTSFGTPDGAGSGYSYCIFATGTGDGCANPAIINQPQSITRNVGTSVPFSVTATGTSLTYQWKKDGTDISGATSSSYTISSIASGDAGNYTVVVSGACGSPVTSNTAVLTVATGTTYYVSTSGVDGSGHTGLSGDPWATLSYAAKRVTMSGDTIYVDSGNYTDNSRCNLSIGVNIQGNSSSRPTITTGYAASGGNDAYIYINSSLGDAVDGHQSVSYLILDGNLTGTRAIVNNFRSNVIIHHCDFYDFYYSAIKLNGENLGWNVTPTNILPTGNKVYNCVFNNCTQATGNSGGGGHIRIEGQNGAEVYNCTFDQTGRAAGENTDIFTGYQNRGMKIHDCVLTKDDTNGTDWNFFAEFHYSNGGFELYNNTFNGAACWDASGNEDKYSYGFGLKIYDNTFQTSGPPPIDVSDHRQAYIDLESFTYEDDIYIFRNHFKYPRIGVHLNNITTQADNIWIYDNIFEDVGNATDNYSYGIKIESNWAGKDPIPISNVHIYNNVIDAGTSALAGIHTSVMGTITNMNIRNNIIVGNFNYPIIFNSSGSSRSVTTLNINNNIFYGTDYTSISFASGITYTNRDDSGNLTSDPLFIGGSPYNFHLSSTSSPAYHAGTNVGLSTDYDEGTWYNPPSIGAYEFISGDNHPPSIQDQGFQLNKNSPNSTAVGTVVASDSDAGQTLTYSIVSGNTNGAFAIDALTGVLSAANSEALNVDFALVVKVQDNGAGELSSQATISINISAIATTYYISPNGSNTANGSITNPWKTLAYACARVTTPGDTIHVNEGTYVETAQSVLALGVSILGTGDASIITTNTALPQIIYLSSASEGTNGNQSISYIKVDGNLTAKSGIKVFARSNVHIHHITVVDIVNYGLIFSGQRAGFGGEPTIYATGNLLYNNLFTNCGTDAYNLAANSWWADAALDINGQDGILIHDNVIDNVTGGRYAYGIKGLGNGGYHKGVKIYNNTIVTNIRDIVGQYTFSFNIELWTGIGGVEIYNNICNGAIDLGGYGWSDDYGYGYACKVYNNTVILPQQLTNSGEAGLILESGSSGGVYFYDNYVRNFTTGMTLGVTEESLVQGYDKVYIYYNLFCNIGYTTGGGGAGISGYSDIITGGAILNDIYILNNVFHKTNSRSGWGVNFETDTENHWTNVYIRNNIIYNAYTSIQFRDQGNIDHIYVDNNIIYNHTNVTIPDYTNTPVTNATFNNNQVGVNPLFINTGSDFRLQVGSPAIDAGIHLTIPFITIDYDSVTIGNPPNIGAYEFISNHPPSIQNQGFQLNENSPNGTAVGTVVASDSDAGQTLTYSIVSGNTNGAFSINDSTGVISVANSSALNFDFALVVKVQDNSIGKLSSQATIRISLIPTGIELTGNNETIKVYPNPVSDELTIEIGGNKDRTGFEILNSIGQIVFEGSLSEKTVVHTTNFSSGVYFLKLKSGKSFEFKKIIKLLN